MRNFKYVVAAGLTILASSPASAVVRYDFTAYSSSLHEGEGLTGGGFSFDVPDFLTSSNPEIPAADLTSCAYSTNLQAIGVVCGEVEFYSNSFYNIIDVATQTTTNPYTRFHYFYFVPGVFGTPGTYDTILPDSGIGRLVVTDLSRAVPEPATWAMMIAGFGMTGSALRMRRTASRKSVEAS